MIANGRKSGANGGDMVEREDIGSDDSQTASAERDGASVGEAPPPRPPRSRRLVRGLIALVAAGLTAFLLLYWQERPLREARRELETGDPQRALALVAYFLDSHPQHGPALALQARALAATGQAEGALKLYDQIGAATAADIHGWARAYLTRQSWSRALPLLTQVLRLEPDNPEALYEITSCRLRLGLLQEGLESARRLTELPTQQGRGYVLLGAIHNDLGNPQESMKAYEQAMAVCPDGQGLQIPPEELFLQYGTVLVNHGRSQDAVRWLERSIAARPTPAACYHLGNALSQTGKSDAAIQAWQRAIALDNAGVPAREALANAAMQKRDAEEALRWLTPIEKVAEERFSTAYLFQRATTMRQDTVAADRWKQKADALRLRDQRLATVEQLMTRSPHSFWANVARAHRFASRGNWQQAEDMLEELAREAPSDKFVQELATAVRQRGPLPSLERLPVKQF